MSEIIKKIESKMTGKRYADEHPLVLTTIEKHQPMEHAFLTEYFVGVKLGHTVRVDDAEPDQKEAAMKAIKRAITELIFGEFRYALRKAQYSLYDRDFEEARLALEEIEQRMFYE